ncbi:hypothetical protein D046_7372B, partial [Vibrio parahaemolyticus V-223/04]
KTNSSYNWSCLLPPLNHF